MAKNMCLSTKPTLKGRWCPIQKEKKSLWRGRGSTATVQYFFSSACTEALRIS